LRTEFRRSLPSRYSITAVSELSPLTSENPATVTPSISTRKLKPWYGSDRLGAAIGVMSHTPVYQEPSRDDERFVSMEGGMANDHPS
jgi:hypothetical protein